MNSGVLMTDIVSYCPPMGILGALANKLFIQNKLKEIFEYRKTVLEEKYGVFQGVVKSLHS
jgi:ligand-binding SRPBCC domain-containing protein